MNPKVHVVLHLEWTATSPLVVGSGGGASPLINIPALRDAAGRPVVPGSSLKGRVRQMARMLYQTRRGELCQAQAGPPFPPDLDHRRPCRCELCILFGAPGFWPGAVRFPDLAPAAGSDAEFHIRQHVSMDRQRRVAAHGHLFSVEAAGGAPGQGLILTGSVTGFLPEHRLGAQVGLLYSALRLVPALGRGRSQGMGAGHMSVTLGGGLEDKAAELEGWLQEWI